MVFWGVEVRPGEPLKVKPEVGELIHLSQAALGEVDTKGSKHINLKLKIDDKNLIIGYLSSRETPQFNFDLVFEKEFELSHDCKDGSVFFIGYLSGEARKETAAVAEMGSKKVVSSDSDSDDDCSDDSSDFDDSDEISRDESSSDEEQPLPLPELPPPSKKRPAESVEKRPAESVEKRPAPSKKAKGQTTKSRH